LFPIFASYKALKANDQTQLTPWLMYWVVIACVIIVDNFLGWFLSVYHPTPLKYCRTSVLIK
jgi:receptor expression-enhancing protein 1/2/3/4